MDVLLLGPMPTPAVAMLTRSMRADIGVMISASHNPYEDNGIKIFGPDGFKLSDDVEREIEALMESNLAQRLAGRSEEHTSELQSRQYLVCRILLEKKTSKSTG